jgi:hypothetical protein
LSATVDGIKVTEAMALNMQMGRTRRAPRELDLVIYYQCIIKIITQELRSPWEDDFPNIWIHAHESVVKQHPAYPSAKAGDPDAALDSIIATIDHQTEQKLDEFRSEKKSLIISVHAEEAIGVNAIPGGMADIFSAILNWETEALVVQENVVNHTGAGGFARMAKQAFFAGDIIAGRNYLSVDAFIGHGGTIANLRGNIMQQGGAVIRGFVLTGKDFSAQLSLEPDQLNKLREQHGHIESWWRERFRFGFESLATSEVRYLITTPSSETIRTRIEAVGIPN